MISRFLYNKFIDYIESYLSNHSAEIQAFFLAEVNTLASRVIHWIEEKLKEIDLNKED